MSDDVFRLSLALALVCLAAVVILLLVVGARG